MEMFLTAGENMTQMIGPCLSQRYANAEDEINEMADEINYIGLIDDKPCESCVKGKQHLLRGLELERNESWN